ncbi:MAG: hypothetical protein ACLU0O_07850 [Collinsella sp.]
MLDDDDGDVRLQISKDNKSLFITSLVYDSRSEDYYAVFSVVDFKNSNTTTKYEFTSSDDYSLDGPAWISNDGKYGYVIRDYCGDDYDSHSYYDVVTLDLKDKEAVNTSEFDRAGNTVVVNDDGSAIGSSCYVSKKGDATSIYYSNLEHNSLNQDGSLVLGLYNENCDGLGSSSSELESLEMIVVDNKTGETKWRTKYPNDLPFMSEDEYGALSNDGRFALANGSDDNDNNLLYLIDTKTGAHSQINLRGSLEYDRVGDDGYMGSAWFSKDCSLIYAVQDNKDDGFRIDVYKSGISQQSLLADSQRTTAHPRSIPFSSSLLLRFSSRRALVASLSFACVSTLRVCGNREWHISRCASTDDAAEFRRTAGQVHRSRRPCLGSYAILRFVRNRLRLILSSVRIAARR